MVNKQGQSGQGSTSGSGNGGTNGGTTKQPRKKSELRKKLEALKEPKDGEPKTVKIGDKTYHWCEGAPGAHAPKWVAHKPEECNGRKPPREQVTGQVAITEAMEDYSSDFDEEAPEPRE